MAYDFSDPYDPEDRRRALTQGLLAAGLAALGARKGSEYNAFAQAGLLGLGGFNAALRTATDARNDKAMRDMQMARFAQQQEELQRQQQQRAQLESAQRAATLPGTPGMPAQEADSPGGTYMPPTPATPGGFDRQKYGQLLEAIDPVKGLAYQKEIAKPTREVKDTKTLMQNGKRVTVNIYKDGSTEVVPFEPEAEKPHFVSTGNRAGVPLDPFTGKPMGEGLPMGMGPADAARIGIDRQRLGLEQQRFAREGAGGSDKWVNDLDRGVQINMATGDTRPITAGGQPIGTKKDTKLVDGSQRALTVLDMAEGIIKSGDPTGSLAGNLYDMAAGAFGISTAGAKSVAGLQALEGALMMAQPRMEGPQSDKDTALYKQMAGKIGDPNVPNGIKLAAVKVIRDMHQKYSANAGAPAVAQPERKVVRTGTRNGRKVVQYADGTIEEQ